MTLVYLALAWACGIWLAHLLWMQGALGCATPQWPFGVLATAAVVWVLGGRYLTPNPSPARRGESVSPLPGRLLASRAAGEGGREGRFAAALLVFLLLGAWRYHAHPFAACPTAADLAFYNGDEKHTVYATVEGVVVGYPDVRDVRAFYRVAAEKLTIGAATRPVRGEVLVQAPRFPEYTYGDRLLASGQLQTPPVLDDFDYRAYLARQGIHSLLRRARVERTARDEGSRVWAVLYGLRSRGAALLGRVLPEPAAALLVGMTLGIESGIAPAVAEAFKATGTTHVIVISGSNISLLSGALLAVLGRLLGKRRAVLPAAALILLYVLLVGADAAALRAGLMGVLYVFAIAFGRQSMAIVSLFASALLMTLLNPLALWDVSLQLSFMATLGLTLFTPAIEARLAGLIERRLPQERARQIMGVLNAALVVTLAAQITTLPLIVAYFGRLSLVSLLTNFLILPAQPPIMMGGMMTLVAGLLWEPLGRVLGVIPWLFLTYTTTIVRLTAAIPFASVELGALGRVLAPLYYAVLFGMLGVRKLETGSWKGLPWRRLGVGGLAAVGALWLGLTAVNSLPDGRLHLFFVPGEDGEAGLIVTPGGRRAWVWDGRGNGAALASATQPLLTGWRRGVDVALGPPTADGRPQASQVVDPAHLTPGTVIRLDDGVTLTRLGTSDGWALRLRYGEFRALLPSTLSPEAQAALLATGGDLTATLLKTAGPGTGAWPTAAFLAATASQTILWPQDTTYPPDVADLLVERGARRVSADAVIEVISDGQRVWLKQHSGEARR
ncbi:MAG: ComEC/Rec2 family competence protein [Chloroflexi bacterium]|nr:ComEC/Rec2 family competence protein [Chloroflexota bacterium]